MPVVKMISCSDWVVCIIDGEIVLENHSIPAWELLNELQERGILTYIDEEIEDEDMQNRNFEAGNGN